MNIGTAGGLLSNATRFVREAAELKPLLVVTLLRTVVTTLSFTYATM